MCTVEQGKLFVSCESIGRQDLSIYAVEGIPSEDRERDWGVPTAPGLSVCSRSLALKQHQNYVENIQYDVQTINQKARQDLMNRKNK